MLSTKKNKQKIYGTTREKSIYLYTSKKGRARTVELGREALDAYGIGALGEDDETNVVSNVALPLQLLWVEREVRQQRVDVEHDLVAAESGVVRVLTRGVLCGARG